MFQVVRDIAWRLPPILEHSFSPTLKQLVELQFELLSFWLFRIGTWTVDVDHSECFLFVPTPADDEQSKRNKDAHECLAFMNSDVQINDLL